MSTTDTLLELRGHGAMALTRARPRITRSAGKWAVTWIGHRRPEVSQVHLAYITEDRIDKKSFLAINNCFTAVQIIVCPHWVVGGFGVRLVPRSGRQHTGAILQ